MPFRCYIALTIVQFRRLHHKQVHIHSQSQDSPRLDHSNRASSNMAEDGSVGVTSILAYCKGPTYEVYLCIRCCRANVGGLSYNLNLAPTVNSLAVDRLFGIPL